jgi:flagellar export protein FliJ
MTFSLSGLLRVRGAQERVAAERLSRASAERADADAAVQNALSGLEGVGSTVRDARTLQAMAAARAAGHSALSDLRALAQLRLAAESEARTAHIEARRELRGLERLEAAHRAQAARAELAAEQSALDEVAAVRAAGRTAHGTSDEGSAA